MTNLPFQLQPIKYESERPDRLPADYGAYHQLYRLDGELIAMGVIDILPNCVSSVYFMYNKKWEKHSLGKVIIPSLVVSLLPTYRWVSVECDA